MLLSADSASFAVNTSLCCYKLDIDSDMPIIILHEPCLSPEIMLPIKTKSEFFGIIVGKCEKQCKLFVNSTVIKY